MTFQLKPLTTAILLVITAPTFAGETKHHFDIPPQPLDSAMQQLASQAGMSTFFTQQTTAGKQTSGLKGDYSTQEAAAIILAKNNLAPVIADGTISVKPAKSKSVTEESSETPTILETVNVTDKAVKATKDVNAPDNPDYKITNAVSATKTDTPIMETPFSVRVVSHQVLKDQQVVRVDEAIKNVAGVTAQPTNGNLNDAFIVRGFQNDSIYRNGFQLPNSNSKRETANLERIEVLKGPGSILFGRSEPGGIINLVTKKPQATPYYALQQQFGSYGYFRTTGDATSAITKDNSLLYRVNFAYENAGSFRDFQKTDRFFIAPSLTWNISDNTQVNFDVEYQHFYETGDSGQPPLMINKPIANEPVSNRPAPIGRNVEVGEFVNNKNAGDRVYVGFDWTHAFNDSWKLTHRFGAEFWDSQNLYVFFYPGADAQGNLQRAFNNATHQQRQQYYTTLNLTGKFNTGVVEHTLLLGFDYFLNDYQIPDSNCCQSPGAFNVFYPTYLSTAPVFDPANNSSIKNQGQDLYSLYIQDQIKLPFNIFANFGLRYDDASSNSVYSWNNNEPVKTSHNHVSPRGGLLWRPVDWLSLYGSYTSNFGQNTSLWNSPQQAQVKPQTAQQWELGAKTEFLDGRVSASFAYFDLTKQNVGITDYSTPIPVTKTIGEQESRGYEFELSGEVLPGWRVIGAYTNLAYAKVNKDGLDGVSGNTGHRMYLTPRNFGSLWNTYEFQQGHLQGLKLGAGVYAVSQVQGDYENDYQIPGYALVNLLGSYSLKVGKSKVTAQLNVNNLLDKTYYTGSNTAYQIGVGSPRSFMGSIKVEY